MSVSIYEYGDTMDYNIIHNEFFEKIESSLNKVLKTECGKIKNCTETLDIKNLRYLENNRKTISDLIIFYFLNKTVLKHDKLKTKIESNYEKICCWYNTMLDDIYIKRDFIYNINVNLNFKSNIINHYLIDAKEKNE
jgi:hypothetical protein